MTPNINEAVIGDRIESARRNADRHRLARIASRRPVPVDGGAGLSVLHRHRLALFASRRASPILSMMGHRLIAMGERLGEDPSDRRAA